jgi:hypothetical protein
MKTHQEIDKRSIVLSEAVVRIIDRDPSRAGLEKARSVCAKWMKIRSEQCIREWRSILELPWEKIRTILLDPSDEGKRLRQSSPFCGVLSNQDRWDIYKRFQS